MHATLKSAKQIRAFTALKWSDFISLNTGAVGWNDDTNWFLIPKLVEIVGINWFKP